MSGERKLLTFPPSVFNQTSMTTALMATVKRLLRDGVEHLWAFVLSAMQSRGITTYLLMPIAPGGAKAIYNPSPSPSVLGCSCHSRPVGPLLFQLCFSVSPPTVTRPASLPLHLRVPAQGLACSA